MKQKKKIEQLFEHEPLVTSIHWWLSSLEPELCMHYGYCFTQLRQWGVPPLFDEKGNFMTLSQFRNLNHERLWDALSLNFHDDIMPFPTLHSHLDAYVAFIEFLDTQSGGWFTEEEKEKIEE